MKKYKVLSFCGIVVLAIALVLWNLWGSKTRVGFINYQVIALGEMSKANDNNSIKIGEIDTDNLDELDDYDMVFINAMGLRITENQRSVIQKAADGGLPILATAVTNPANNICSVDSVVADSLRKYLINGGRRNYRSLLNYVRKDIDGKLVSTKEPDVVAEAPNDMIYHADPKNPDNEVLGFNSIAEYHKFLKENNLWKEKAPGVVVTGQMGEPSTLIAKLESTGNVVYPVRSMRKFVRNHHIDSIHASAVINMAHGRMGDYMVDYLAKQNIPLFSPLNVNRMVDKWENDPMGMNGGFLSQSVVTPEIDGALRPFVLFGHRLDEDGMQQSYTIPERLETFVQSVNNYITLKSKPNSEKRVAIYYYKGPGQNALSAAGMEVVPSLYNLLVRMKKEGYRVDNLPASHKQLAEMIQAQGAVFNSYAEGAFTKYLQTAKPELISKEQYEGWVKKVLRPEKYAEVVDLNGEFPGTYMVTEDGRLGLPRLDFGNVVLLPQHAAGAGNNSFKIVHGTDAAPPHNYIASYLWTQFGFKADAMIHFGTHGSLEFTPKKQVALSANDWPDRLVGALPHFYIYSIGNVGEGIIAKRRSYAGLQSYLTPPFMESNVRGIYRELHEAIKNYNNILGEDNRNEKALSKAGVKVKEYTVKLGVHRELELDSIKGTSYTEEEVARVESFAEELANEKVTGQLYTMGVPYENARIESSVYAMSVEPIAYSLLALDKLRGKAAPQVEKHRSVFTQRYLNPARSLVTRLLASKNTNTDEMVLRMAKITKEELAEAHEIDKARNQPDGLMAMMMAASEEKESGSKQGMMGTMDGHKGKPAMGGQSSMMKDFVEAIAKTEGASNEKNLSGIIDKMPETIKSKIPAKMLEAMRHMTIGEAMAMMKSGKHPSVADNHTAKTKQVNATSHKSSSSGMAAMMKKMMKKNEYSKELIIKATAIIEVERTIKNVHAYREALRHSPEMELASMINGMNGGYTRPSPGGDPIANPNTLPTGRNLYSINAEATPSEAAWEKGIRLANNTINMYKKRHNDSIPRKVSYTLWSGEFIETEGATIAQILYMLGVEPIRDAFGRVNDIRLIPSKELGRPRIDVVVQTSGQLRDLAASRLFLINRAVEMAAAAKNDEFQNMVAEGVVEAERSLIEKGLTPKDAREMAAFRVFGGMNGGYGTGIQGMVEAGDRWESEKEIADTYLNNMGAYYGSEKNWEVFKQFAFEAALTRTDAVIQPRQSNTWGALSLDHVYEFMGGMNLAVRNVTGKDPDAYLSDYRNRNNVRMQEVKEAIGVESRTTIFNPNYIREKMKGEASSAGSFAEIIRNTYGWNVMKPEAIDKEMWDEIYNVYVKDKFDLGMQKYFENQNPAALQEITAVMMETVRKGMWKASKEQLAEIAKVHTELVEKYNPACSGFVCDNAKLRDFIASNANANTAQVYKEKIRDVRENVTQSDDKGMVMKKQEMSQMENNEHTNTLSDTVVVVSVVVAFVFLILVIRRKRKLQE